VFSAQGRDAGLGAVGWVAQSAECGSATAAFGLHTFAPWRSVVELVMGTDQVYCRRVSRVPVPVVGSEVHPVCLPSCPDDGHLRPEHDEGSSIHWN
jgi:hypothetical protein